MLIMEGREKIGKHNMEIRVFPLLSTHAVPSRCPSTPMQTRAGSPAVEFYEEMGWGSRFCTYWTPLCADIHSHTHVFCVLTRQNPVSELLDADLYVVGGPKV